MQTRRKHINPFVSTICLLAVFIMIGASVSPALAQEGGGQWFAFGEKATASPEVQILSASGEAIDVQAIMPGTSFGHTVLGDQSYLSFESEEYLETTEIGAPALPVLRQMIEVPLGAEISVEILEAQTQNVNLEALGFEGQIAAVQPSPSKCSDSEPVVMANPQYYGNSFYPAENVAIVNDSITRGHRILTVEIRPVRYNAVLGEMETTSDLSFRLNLAGSDMALTFAEADRLNSDAFNNSLKNVVLNYNQGRPLAVPNEGERILIITADQWQAGLAPFVALKQSQGFTVSVVNITTVGGNTTSAIKSYIQGQYQGSTPPTYVILVGDYVSGNPVGSITNFTMKTSGSYRTDLHYFTMDGDTDYDADIYYGRFPVRTNEHLTAMVNKYLDYDDLGGDEAWVKKAAFLASNDSSYYDYAERTHNYVIDNYTLPLGYTGIFPNNPQPGGDKVYAISHNGTGAHAVNAMNDGRALLIYSGHGAETFWDAPRVTQNDIRNMTGNVIPYVASHACITSDFNTQEAFSDTWVITANKGAQVFLGSSDSTYWPEDEALEKAIFDHLYEDETLEEIPSISSMLKYGLTFVNGSRRNYYRETYHIFGDPSLEIIMGPKFPGFRISVEPESLKTCNVGKNIATINLRSINEFASPVTLSASALQGYTTTFAKNPLIPAGSTTATILGDGNAPTSVQTLTITGTFEELVETAEVELNIFKPISNGPTLKSPANNARDVPQLTTFSWNAIGDAETYHLQVSLDRNFDQLVVDRSGISGTSFTLANNLISDSQFYWRVAAENVCGKVESDQVFTFRTKPGPGDCAQGRRKESLYFTDFNDGLDGWTTDGSASTTIKFDITTVRAFSNPQSVLGTIPATISDQRLISPEFEVPQTTEPVSLIFWHYWTFDSDKDCNDGAILEASLDGGTTWNQVAKPYLLTNPYNGVVKTGSYNPLVGKNAWCGSTNDWMRTVVDLKPFMGKTVQFRFRLGSSNAGAAEGWYIDDVNFQTCVQDDAPLLNFDVYLPYLNR